MNKTPTSILIIGSGVFGLTTLYELLGRARYRDTTFTLLSQSLPSFDEDDKTSSDSPTWQGSSDRIASHDTTRIIRADYADPVYSSLANEAQKLWRAEWGADGRYTVSGLLLSASKDSDGDTYVASVLRNLREDPKAVRAIKELHDHEAIASALCAPGAAVGTGDRGYYNGQSGWADASATMAWLYRRVQDIAGDRVRFVRESASELVHDAQSNKVDGVLLENGAKMTADLTILATGAWTPALVDLRGIASARGQCIAYIDITSEEAETLRDMPVHMNLTSGCFVFPPTHVDDRWELKVARHAYGYANPVSITPPLGAPENAGELKISLPSFEKGLPRPDARMMKDFIETAVPLIAPLDKKKRNMRPRKCWYLDTASGDYVVCHHPQFQGLFLATGGSGHAFKFVPSLGKHIVDVLEGQSTASQFIKKWAWPTRSNEDEVWCGDHSRAGEPGMTLEEAFKIP